MHRYPITGRSLEWFFTIDGDLFERQYKRHLSGYWEWKDTAERHHAGQWRVFPENIGAHHSTDETSLSNGELYTIVTNKASHGREHSLVAIVLGTDSDDVLRVISCINAVELNSLFESGLSIKSALTVLMPFLS